MGARLGSEASAGQRRAREQLALLRPRVASGWAMGGCFGVSLQVEGALMSRRGGQAVLTHAIEVGLREGEQGDVDGA